jgi:hypothetical protein
LLDFCVQDFCGVFVEFLPQIFGTDFWQNIGFSNGKINGTTLMLQH